MSLKEKFVQKRIRDIQKHPVQLKKPEAFTRIILVTNSYDEELFEAAKKGFTNAEINMLYLRKSKQDESTKFHYSIHPADFNLTGHLKNDKLQKLLQINFDLILDLSENLIYLKYLVSQMHTTLSIGKLKTDSIQSHDLTCEFNQSKNEFIITVVHQLNLLTKNEK